MDATLQAEGLARHDRAMRRRVAWLLFLSLIGYPLAGTLVVMSPLPSLAASVPVRLAVLALSLSILFALRRDQPLLLSLRHQPLTPLRAALLLFWIAYLGRLLWDWQVAGFTDAGEALLFATLVGIVPAIALAGVEPRHWDTAALARLLLFGGALTCAAAVAAELSGVAASRSLTEATGRLSFDTVNPITYGQVAATTLLTAAALWFDPGMAARPWLKGAALAAAAVALLCLQMSGSKGPLLALLLSFVGVGVFHHRFRRKLLLLIALVAVAVYMALDSPLAQRLLDSDEDLSTIERRELLGGAIGQFVDNPLLGSAFVELQHQTYPHNPFAEAAMATGVFGLALYAVVVVGAMLRLPALLSTDRTMLLAAVALLYLVAEHISGSLWASGGLWICLAVTLSLARAGGRTSGPAPVSAKPT